MMVHGNGWYQGGVVVTVTCCCRCRNMMGERKRKTEEKNLISLFGTFLRKKENQNTQKVKTLKRPCRHASVTSVQTGISFYLLIFSIVIVSWHPGCCIVTGSCSENLRMLAVFFFFFQMKIFLLFLVLLIKQGLQKLCLFFKYHMHQKGHDKGFIFFKFCFVLKEVFCTLSLPPPPHPPSLSLSVWALSIFRVQVQVISLRQWGRERQWGFWMIAITVTGHLRPILYIHRTLPSSSNYLWECPFFFSFFFPLL